MLFLRPGWGSNSPAVYDKAAGAWSPLSLTGLIGWWKADAGTFSDAGSTPQTTNGGSIKQWNDQSGNGNHLSSFGTSDPIYDTTDALNGHPVINCVTGAVGLRTGSLALGGTTLSCFALVKISSYGSANRIFELDNGTAGIESFIFHPSATELKTQASGSTKADTGTGALTGTNWNQIGAIWDGTNANIYVGNVSKAFAADAPTFPNPLTHFCVGLNRGGGNASNAYFSEMILTTSAMSSGDRSSLAAYLTSRWGV